MALEGTGEYRLRMDNDGSNGLHPMENEHQNEEMGQKARFEWDAE